MKTIGMEQATLDACVRDAQRDRVIVTRNGLPVALVGVEGLDEEQVELASSDDFWRMIVECRRQKTLSRNELELRAGAQAETNGDRE